MDSCTVPRRGKRGGPDVAVHGFPGYADAGEQVAAVIDFAARSLDLPTGDASRAGG